LSLDDGIVPSGGEQQTAAWGSLGVGQEFQEPTKMGARLITLKFRWDPGMTWLASARTLAAARTLTAARITLADGDEMLLAVVLSEPSAPVAENGILMSSMVCYARGIGYTEIAA
jgi:hypothetical protein